YCVSGVASTSDSTSARPSAVSHTTSPSRRIAALRLGMRFSRCATRTSWSSFAASVSGVDTNLVLHPLDRLVDLVVTDAEMRDRPQPARAQAADADTSREQPLSQAGLVGDGNEVRLDGRRIDPDSLREPLRSCMVVGEPLDVVVERVEHRGGRDARLPE